VAVGASAGATLTTGTTSTFIGNTADTTLATITNATALGFGASVAAANTMVFGNTSVVAVLPGPDAGATLGSSAKRWTTVNASSQFNAWIASADANPGSRLGTTALLMGAGGATALDLSLSRTGTREWSFGDNAGGAADIDVIPIIDNVNNLGTAAKRWKLIRGVTVTAGDLELESPETGAKWTVREATIPGEDIHALFAIDHNTGKKYRLALQETL
jgi:hypothetical protein